MKRLFALALLAFTTSANAECLPSARAVWNAHDGKHATWANVDGRKCWSQGFPKHERKVRHLVTVRSLNAPQRSVVPSPRPRPDWEILHPERYHSAAPAEGRGFVKEFWRPEFDETFAAAGRK